MPLRVLKPAGIERFRAYLLELGRDPRLPPPAELLEDDAFAEPFEPGGEVEARRFEDRLEAARYLESALALAPAEAVEENVGLWSWLSLLYFDTTAPPGLDGARRPGRTYRHILEPGYPYGHRHLLAGPWLVYELHGEAAVLLLSSKVHVENGFHHEIASRQSLISNPAVIEALNVLYLRWGRFRRRPQPKPGAQAGRSKPGTLLRFVDVVQQLEVNYDLYSMSAEDILSLLPEEFDAWKPGRMRRQHRRERRHA